MTSEAIAVLPASVKQDASGRWVSADLTAADDALGAPGGKLRIVAASVLLETHPEARIVTGGGKGFDVGDAAAADRPLLADILQDELLECGVPEERLILERESNTTYQGLQELERIARERGFRRIHIISNRYHLARVRAVLDAKFVDLCAYATVELVSAEDILLSQDPGRWRASIEEAYQSGWMKERMHREEQGIAQIKNGTYHFQ